MTPTEQDKELDVNKLEQIIADHNKEMRTDMASEITGGTRSKAITDVITVKAILGWHNKQIEEVLDRLENKGLLLEHSLGATDSGRVRRRTEAIEAERNKLKESV